MDSSFNPSTICINYYCQITASFPNLHVNIKNVAHGSRNYCNNNGYFSIGDYDNYVSNYGDVNDSDDGFG